MPVGQAPTAILQSKPVFVSARGDDLEWESGVGLEDDKERCRARAFSVRVEPYVDIRDEVFGVAEAIFVEDDVPAVDLFALPRIRMLDCCLAWWAHSYAGVEFADLQNVSGIAELGVGKQD